MRAAAIFLSIMLLPTLAQAADSTLVRKASAHSVAMTLDRLTTIVESKGAKVFARVPHSSGAQKVGMELRPTEALIFGNPKLGTPALQASQEMGLDLPLRVVAYEAADGKVWLAYRAPGATAAAHGVPADAPEILPIEKALNALTDAAVKAD